MCLKYCCLYSKQCRPWSEPTECSVWSGSTQFEGGSGLDQFAIVNFVNPATGLVGKREKYFIYNTPVLHWKVVYFYVLFHIHFVELLIQVNNYYLFLLFYSGFTSLSIICHIGTVSGCGRELSAASLKVHAQDKDIFCPVTLYWHQDDQF